MTAERGGLVAGAAVIIGVLASCAGDQVSETSAPGNGDAAPASSGDAANSGNSALDVAAPLPDASLQQEASATGAEESVNPPPSTEGGSPTGPCGAAGIIVCDDFESAALDTTRWLAVNVDANNTLTVDTTRAKSGSRSLHVHVSSMAGSALLQTMPLPALPSNTLWGRAYLYFAAPAPMTHAGVIIGEGTWPAGHTPQMADYNFGMQNGMWLTDYQTNTDENPANSSTSVATGQWSCLEWYFKGDTGDFAEYLDGNLVMGANAQGQPVPAFHDVQIGLDLCCGDPQSVAAFDLWVDAVALGTQRVGCL